MKRHQPTVSSFLPLASLASLALTTPLLPITATAVFSITLTAKADPHYRTETQQKPVVEFASESALFFWSLWMNLGYLPGGDSDAISVSPLSQAQAFVLFERLKNSENIDFRMIRDGCYARAHEMAQILDQNRITSGKVFVTGELTVPDATQVSGLTRWHYHVAPVVLVRREETPQEMSPQKKSGPSKLQAWVLDPGLFDHPTPLQEWLDSLQGRATTPLKFSFYSRFRYGPDEADPKTFYRDKDLIDQREKLAELRQRPIVILKSVTNLADTRDRIGRHGIEKIYSKAQSKVTLEIIKHRGRSPIP